MVHGRREGQDPGASRRRALVERPPRRSTTRSTPDTARLPWARILQDTRDSHSAVFELLRTYPNGAVAEPERYPWANGALIDLADECTGKHYDWGVERVEAYLQSR